jgi:hypothetical protein
MDPKFVPSKIIESAPVGPLSAYIEPYIAFVRELGFAPRSVYEQVRVIVTFSRSLLRSGCKIRDLNESVTERFLSDELRDQWPHVAAPATLRRLLTLLRRIGVVRSKASPARSPAQRLTDDYRRFLLTERALSPATVDAWVRFIETFLCEIFGANTLKLSKLRPIDVTAFVRRHARCHSPSSARKLVTAMRSFLWYLRYRGLVEVDLDKAVPRVARWSLSDLTGLSRANTIAKIVQGALERAGVESARKGAHLLRHSLATSMLRNGASLGEIGELLRHKSPDSTAIYAKVELGALKPLALRWPGGDR